MRTQILAATVIPYRSGDRCPGCAGTNWLIGRHMAECGRCHFAVPLERKAA